MFQAMCSKCNNYFDGQCSRCLRIRLSLPEILHEDDLQHPVFYTTWGGQNLEQSKITLPDGGFEFRFFMRA
eukprot:9486991-Pyramimonas_sp.AAC.1